MNQHLTLKLAQLKGSYRGIITPSFKVIAIAPSNIQPVFCKRLDHLFSQGSYYNTEQNETLKNIFGLITELVSYDKKQTKKHNDLKKLSYCYMIPPY